MIGFLIFLAMIFFLGVVPPPRWGLRLAVMVGGLLTLGAYVLPAPYEEGWAHDIVQIAFVSTIAAYFSAVALRWLASGLRPEPSFDDTLLLRAFDEALCFGAGVFLGCVVFHALAILLGNLPGGLFLHVAVAVVAGLGVAFTWRTRARAVALGAGLTVAALALDGGFRYPDLMLRAAEAAGPEVPRCLMIGPDLAPPRDRTDLMALTIPKDVKGPSDVLLLRQEGGSMDLLRWSFRARRFVPAPTYIYAPPLCTPTLAPLLPG